MITLMELKGARIMYDINKIGCIIKQYRIERQISQEALAEIVDITPTHLKHIESGHRRPSVEVMFSIFNTLSISFDELKDCINDKSLELIKINQLLEECEKEKLNTIYKITKVIVDK